MTSSPAELRVRAARPEDAEAVRELIAAFDKRHLGEADMTADDQYAAASMQLNSQATKPKDLDPLRPLPDPLTVMTSRH